MIASPGRKCCSSRCEVRTRICSSDISAKSETRLRKSILSVVESMATSVTLVCVDGLWFLDEVHADDHHRARPPILAPVCDVTRLRNDLTRLVLPHVAAL